jgi:hypothetical protein
VNPPSWVAYIPIVVVALFLNVADVYFLQQDSLPRFHRAVSFWLYVTGHVLIALATGFLLYVKAKMPVEDWPIVTMLSALSGFSILQSFTLKFGDKGVDARELFDAWKRRVIEDVAKSNTSRKRADQLKTAQLLAKKSAGNTSALELAIGQLAPALQQDPQKLLDQMKATSTRPEMLMAQWIVSVDLEFAQNLARDI